MSRTTNIHLEPHITVYFLEPMHRLLINVLGMAKKKNSGALLIFYADGRACHVPS